MPETLPPQTEEEKFEKAIDAAIERGESPWNERKVYADWLQEQNTPEGYKLALAQRWMIENNKRPYHGLYGWEWWSNTVHFGREMPGNIPMEVLNRMPRTNRFSTRQEAEMALAEALTAAGIMLRWGSATD